MDKTRVLVLDDEAGIRLEIRDFLLSKGFVVHEASAPSEAFQVLRQHPIDIAICDIRLPEMSGLEVLHEVKRLYPRIEVIMISGHGDMDSVIEALRKGACDFLKKPFHLKEVMSAIEKTSKFIRISKMLEKKASGTQAATTEKWNKFGAPFIFGSLAMEMLYDQMVKVSVSDTTSVLITGESGTGKELVARGIHMLSQRNDKPFFSVNCSSVPDELFESEFFGYSRGAFTGALTDKAGWFEAANGGTLFLDEIGDLKLTLQSKLLRVLEDHQVTRLGTTSSLNVDVRLIAATNHDLVEMTRESAFREDLFHRLNTFVLRVPPLRERKDDIPLLFDYFVRYYSGKLRKEIVHVHKTLAEALLRYDFPGNVRELRHMTERAVILCEGKDLTIDHFDNLNYKVRAAQIQAAPAKSLKLDQLERENIEKALKATNYKKSKAAQLLNISRQALDRKLARYNITV